eukprot:gene25789-33679_t
MIPCYNVSKAGVDAPVVEEAEAGRSGGGGGHDLEQDDDVEQEADVEQQDEEEEDNEEE